MTCFPTPYKPKSEIYGETTSPFSSQSPICVSKENPYSKIQSPYTDEFFCYNYLLQENGSFLLQENGSKILL